MNCKGLRVAIEMVYKWFFFVFFFWLKGEVTSVMFRISLFVTLWYDTTLFIVLVNQI